MNTVINPLAKTKVYMRINRTKEDETLYFLAEAALLVIATREKKLYYVHGDTAEFLYKKLAVDTEKRKKCEDDYMKRMLTFFHKQIDETADSLESLAGLEKILDKLEQDSPEKSK